VGVVTNISADHMGLGGINTLEELARVKQVVIEAVADDGAAILNAEDPMVAEMAAATDAEVIYFSTNSNNHIIQAHLMEDGRCVFIENNFIVLATDGQRIELIELDRVEFTKGGKIQFQVQNALAATAAAWAAGLNPAMIARALSTFKTDTNMVPGRFNVSEVDGIEIILDYGHNQAALQALAQALLALDERPTTLVISLPGDRRNEDLVATLKTMFPVANRYFLHDQEGLRGRVRDEVPQLLASCIPAGVPFEITRSEHESIMKAWTTMQPGQRLVIISDIVDTTQATLDTVLKTKRDAECTYPLQENYPPRTNQQGWLIQSE